MNITGKLKAKFDTQKVSEKFQKRDFVLTTDHTTPYPQQVSFQLTQDKVALLDNFNEGDKLTVDFNLRGREWNSPQGVKYFNTLEAWRIVKAQGGNSTPPPTAFISDPMDNDDLPF